ncbi:hypothetical protein JNJ66_04470 [Candidatus Saccharibacteria bacterium]|nr:hypothetical protein [Candidatus Saccharibacteria bacterium]
MKNHRMLLVGAFAVALLAVVALVGFNISNTKQQVDTPTPGSTGTVNKTSKHIETADKIDNIDPLLSPPADWKSYKDQTLGLALSHPAELYPKSKELSSTANGGPITQRSVLFYDKDGVKSEKFKIIIYDLPVEGVIKDFEDKDTGDDGRVVQKPLVIWVDIKSKDFFKLNDKEGVRLVSTKRTSSSSQYQMIVSYIIGHKNKTYVYQTDSDSTENDALAFMILRSITFE